MITHFDGYTCAELPSFGVWKDGAKLYYDRCKLYEVSFKGKEQIPEFIKKLTDLCVAMGERAIYFKAGQYSCLIKPKNK
jgi:hypothetical protein